MGYAIPNCTVIFIVKATGICIKLGNIDTNTTIWPVNKAACVGLGQVIIDRNPFCHAQSSFGYFAPKITIMLGNGALFLELPYFSRPFTNLTSA
jgi:hypothetical protein